MPTAPTSSEITLKTTGGIDIQRLRASKIRILEAAESLYTTNAIEAVSLREIALAAGNQNTNAVQYHFGGKDELLQAIFSWRVWQMESPRQAMLAHAERDNKLSDFRTLAEVLCLPLLDLTDAEGRHSYAAFLIQYQLRMRPLGISHAADEPTFSNSNIARLLHLIYGCMQVPDREKGDYRVALGHLIFANMLVLSDVEQLPRLDPQAFAKRIEVTLDMVAAAFSAGASGGHSR